MRRAIPRVVITAFVTLSACHSPTTAPVVDPDVVETFQLTTIDTTVLTGHLNEAPYIFAGKLSLIVGGTFTEVFTRACVTRALGAGNSRTAACPDVHTGFWRELPDGRFEFRYADRRPQIVDTSATTSSGFTKGCRAFAFCFSNDHLLTFVR